MRPPLWVDLASDESDLPRSRGVQESGRQSEGVPMASKLYIGGLAYSTTSEGLREFFTQCGNVLSATVITDRFSGQSRGFGFVEMNTAEEAQASISQLNGRELDGRRITVAISNPQAPRPGGGRPGCVRGPAGRVPRRDRVYAPQPPM